MNNCKGIFGWLFGHKIVGYCNETESVMDSVFEILSDFHFDSDRTEAIEASKNKTKTLACCVCKRCGQRVENTESSHAGLDDKKP